MDEDLTRRAIAWRHTGDAEHPYVAEVGGRTLTIRINDFPAEPLYTLLEEGQELTDLEDWPAAWAMPSPPKALLDALVVTRKPRLEGRIRLAAVSESGEAVLSLALDGDEVVAGASRRLDRATLAERPSKEPARPEPPPIELGGEGARLIARSLEAGLAIAARATAAGDEVWLQRLGSGTRRTLGIGQPRTVAAAISPVGGAALVLDVGGEVRRLDLGDQQRPRFVRVRRLAGAARPSLDLSRGGRMWAAAARSTIEIRVMTDADPIATVDLAPLADEVTSVLLLPDEPGLLAGTARGHVLRFDLLLDRVGATREDRLACVADAVDAAIAGTRWDRYDPRVVIDEERTEGGRAVWYFVADHDEYHQAQSGSDWEDHILCAGRATFEDDRCVDVEVTSIQRRRLTERQAEDYDARAELEAFRAAIAHERSASAGDADRS